MVASEHVKINVFENCMTQFKIGLSLFDLKQILFDSENIVQWGERGIFKRVD